MSGPVISLEKARKCKLNADCDAMLDAHERDLEAHPERMADVAGMLLGMDARTLARVERKLAAGVFERGPRKGQPYDADAHFNLEAWAARLRVAIGDNRARVARAVGPRLALLQAKEEGPEASA